MSYIKGTNRSQITLFPEIVDEYIMEDNPVRFIDLFVDNLGVNSFKYSETNKTGRPPYNPKDLLKLYIYGYLNHIRSSRKLERETHRNVEIMWLLQRLKPDHKTIANFRRDNKESIKQVFREFTLLCKKLDLFGGELIAIDGSKFKAVNSKKKAFTDKQLEEKISDIEKYIENYLNELDSNDDEEFGINAPSKKELQGKIEFLKNRKKEYQKIKAELEQTGKTHLCLTDPDARLMKEGGSSKKSVSYNVQTSVDSKHNLIVNFDVTQDANDVNQLSNMAIEAKEVLEAENIEAIADTGYYSGKEFKKCIEEGITPYVSEPAVGKCEKIHPDYYPDKFKYDKKADCYTCPKGEILTFKGTKKSERGYRVRLYRTSSCKSCDKKDKCTTSKKGRTINRSEYTEYLEDMKIRVNSNKEKVKKRKSIVEAPFGTIKESFGYRSLLMKGLSNVKTEMSLAALAFNMKRAINILGIKELIKAMA